MEHRYDTRFETQIRVLIYMKPNIFVAGTTRDMSAGGLSVMPERSGDLKKNALVKVTYVANGRLVIHKAQILRLSDDRMALMFVDQEPRGGDIDETLQSPDLSAGSASTRKAWRLGI
ncbi:MAG: PilZ domain-containing protein [Pseudomonadota bacterium]